MRGLALGLAGMMGLQGWGAGAVEGEAAAKFAALALKCARQEYPNKLDHVMNGPAEVLGPKALHPAFYGCFDWHSAVHGHWVMVRVLREHPDLPEAAELRRVLDAHLAPGPIAQEVAYLGQGNRASFERTYGWAWLLKLAAELRSWDAPEARRWEAALQPLTAAVAARFKAYLPKATYPIRTGVHPNTAYSLNLALDYARAVQDRDFEGLIAERAQAYFGRDQRAPLTWEPGAEDFLSPTLEEAALMARLLPASAFRKWLPAFLPGYGLNLQPALVSDRSDPKIVHPQPQPCPLCLPAGGHFPRGGHAARADPDGRSTRRGEPAPHRHGQLRGRALAGHLRPAPAGGQGCPGFRPDVDERMTAGPPGIPLPAGRPPA